MTGNPKKTTLALLTGIVSSACFLDYWAYSRDYYQYPGIWMDLVHGTGTAPSQYRVGVIQAAYWMTRHLHMGMRHAFTLLDAIAGLVAVYLLYDLVRRSEVYRRASVLQQWFGSAALVVLVQYYLAWLVWYQRPETLPITMLLAILLWLWTKKGVGLELSTGGKLLTAALIIVVSALQALLRADMAVALNFGVLAVCVTRFGKHLALPRMAAAATSLAAMLLAGGIQVYIMKVVYPHATYGDTQMFQLKHNLVDPLRLLPFGLYMIPYIWLLVRLMKRRFTADAAGLAFVAGSLVFIATWFVMGMIDEVRIFMPIALVLTPIAVQLAMEGPEAV